MQLYELSFPTHENTPPAVKRVWKFFVKYNKKGQPYRIRKPGEYTKCIQGLRILAVLKDGIYHNAITGDPVPYNISQAEIIKL